MPAAIPIAASVAGAAVSSSMNKGSSGGGTVSKDPWAPAAPHLTNTLDRAGLLQEYQMQNPWNPMQQTAYQNTYTDLDSFRDQNNGLMGFANKLMGSNYSRNQPQGGLLSMPQGGQQMQMQGRPQGLLGQGVFSIPQGQKYGQLNWQELNPWTATGGPRIEKKKEETDEERKRREEEERKRNWINPDLHGAGD
jgi:hypothetical protein